MAEDEVISFIRQSVGSVYALEMLLLFLRRTGKAWLPGDLIRELRSSGTAVSEALARLVQAGMVAHTPDDHYVFSPASPWHLDIAGRIENLYTNAPVSVMKAMVMDPKATSRR